MIDLRSALIKGTSSTSATTGSKPLRYILVTFGLLVGEDEESVVGEDTYMHVANRGLSESSEHSS
jgi:hypothetical protein